MGELIAALDVGKTHTRLSLMDADSGAEISSTRRLNPNKQTAMGRALDVTGGERWLIDTLRQFPDRHRICAVVPIAHGAAAVFVDHDGRVVAAPDYEDACFDLVHEEYETERDPFTQTYSPSLPGGLNLGRQIFYLERQTPQLYSEIRQILLYPQYWAWRLSGVAASETTSLGCHSDLWQPYASEFSGLARRRNWAALFPSRRFAAETIGHAHGPLAHAAGLPRSCRIVCGIHDSNASYLRYLIGRRDEPFAVISSGTWTVVMANRASSSSLSSERDMLANVDAFGSPVPTARFMGGREYQAIARTTAEPSLDALVSVTQKRAMAWGSFAPGGPFAGQPGRLHNADALSEVERAALATLYVALMSHLLLDTLKARGDVIVDGPLASNPLYAGIMAALRPGVRVLVDEGRCPTAAVSYLAGLTIERKEVSRICERVAVAGLEEYWQAWRARLPGA